MLNADQEFVSERPHLTKHQPKTPICSRRRSRDTTQNIEIK